VTLQTVIPIVVVFGFAALFAAAPFARGAFGVRSRLELVNLGVDAVAVLALGHVLLPWALIPPALWLVPVALTAIGVAGTALRWTSLPLRRPDRRAWAVVAAAVVNALVAVAVLALVFWP
jgi:hypothetical protein